MAGSHKALDMCTSLLIFKSKSTNYKRKWNLLACIYCPSWEKYTTGTKQHAWGKVDSTFRILSILSKILSVAKKKIVTWKYTNVSLPVSLLLGKHFDILEWKANHCYIILLKSQSKCCKLPPFHPIYILWRCIKYGILFIRWLEDTELTYEKNCIHHHNLQ